MRRNRTNAAWPESSNDRAAGDPLERRFLPTPDEILGTVRDGNGDAATACASTARDLGTASRWHR